MDTLFHFVFPMIAALAARLNIKHKVKTLLSLAFLTILLDADHISLVWERALLHNVFVTFLLPVALIILSFMFKMDRYKKSLLILLLIFLSSHVVLDLFTNFDSTGIGIANGEYGLALFYPFSSERYVINFNIMAKGFVPVYTEGYLVSSIGFGILIYSLLILLPCISLEDIIDIAEKKHEKFRKASSQFLRNLMRD
jgi:membrane-bound metal-dependent hydrolase YbcI (DUF457 family)